ncbi:Hypothetical predicted protein [Octopus vulgaris]|uniref:Titin n=1 Tax=Octopus vulgaris TaxID=6645 RepID=A0AA36FA02_OCTVU|nr:Hypothetical predicted protein [Octopus vulgaris]
MKSVVYLLTVAVIFLLEEIDGNQIQSSNLSCALVPGRSNSTYYEPVWDYIWIRRSCMFGRVFSDRYCLCIPTQLMRNTRRNTPNTCIFRGSKTYTRRIDPKNSYYQERVKTRKWAPKTCTSGLVFSPTHCRCIEDSRETCQYPGAITRTRKRDTDVNYFQQLTNSNTWERKRCYSGATFSLTKCYCTFGGSPVIVTTPEPENDIKICKHPKYGYFRKRDSNPQFYFQINNNKAWEKRACAVGGTFNSAICDCTYVKPTSESETTPKVEPEIPQKFCWDALSKTRRGTFRDERYYYELKGNTWKVIACQNGYIFSHDRCCCVLKSQITTPRTEPTGEPETEPTGEPETPFKVCPHKPSQSIRRATTNPQIYELKTTGGKWVKISCEAANQFNVKKCCCVPTGTTAQPEGTTKFSPKYCLDKLSSKRRATFRNERHYYELTDSLWRLEACKNGKIFSYEECCCVLKSKQTTNPWTEPTSEPKTEPTSKPETEPTGEPETEPTGEPEAQFQICPHNSSQSIRRGTKNPQIYEQVNKQGKWERKLCNGASRFNVKKCCCISPGEPETEPTGEPETPFEVCWHKSSQSKRRVTANPQIYEQKTTGGKWERKLCNGASRFNAKKCCCVSPGEPETEPTGEPETEPTGEPETPFEVCWHKSSQSKRRVTANPQIYEQKTTGGKWERKLCNGASRFNAKKCCCVSPGEPETEPTGEPETLFEVCRHKPSQSIRRSTTNPQIYEQVNKQRKWERKICNGASRFNAKKCCCVSPGEPETEPTGEPETEPTGEPETPFEVCWHKSSQSKRRATANPQIYEQKTTGGKWERKLCNGASRFSAKKCCCVSPGEPETEPTGEPETEPTGEPEAQFQICPHNSSQSIRRGTKNPQIYEQVNKQGKWERKLCNGASRFNAKKCCCVSPGEPETEPTGEPETEPTGEPETPFEVCWHKSSQSKRRATANPQIYEQKTTGGKWERKLCNGASRFSAKKCCCVSPGEPETEPTGEPETEPTGEPEAQFQICPHNSSQSIRRGTKNPQIYEQVNKQGKWERKLCNGASRFNAKKCCCVSPGEPETEPTGEPETPFEVCSHKPSQSIRRGTKNPQIYEQVNKQRKWERKICNGASRFNAKKCCCVSTGTTPAQPEGEPEHKPETEPTGKPETEPEGKPEGEPEIAEKICHHKPSKIQRKTFKVELFYYEKTGNTWMLKVCQNGYIFSYEECCCALKSKQIANPETEPEGKPESEPEGEPEGEPKPENEVQHAYCIDVISRAIRKNTTNPKQYKQLSSSFKWEVKYCPHSKRFSFKICCCVPVTPGQPEGEPEGKPETEPEGKPETEPEGKPEELFKICPHKPSESIRRNTTNPQFYEQMTIRNEWVKMSCGDASRFDVDQCSCIPTEKTTPTTTQRSYDTAQANIACKVGNGPLRKTDSDLRRYSEKVAGRWEDRICYSGGIFNKLICGCVYLKKIQK